MSSVARVTLYMFQNVKLLKQLMGHSTAFLLLERLRNRRLYYAHSIDQKNYRTRNLHGSDKTKYINAVQHDTFCD